MKLMVYEYMDETGPLSAELIFSTSGQQRVMVVTAHNDFYLDADMAAQLGRDLLRLADLINPDDPDQEMAHDSA